MENTLMEGSIRGTAEVSVQSMGDDSVLECSLVGDFSRPCSLATTAGRMCDVPSISPATLTQILKDSSHNVTVLDCRYPYEYEGGHIVGAMNMYSKDLVMEKFLSSKQPLTSVTSSREILVFHCEFSIERGPNMVRFLREADRSMNMSAYPALHYPEIYLLHGGYKAFWDFCNHSNQTEMCEPSNYRPMLKEAFKEEMRKYRDNGKSRKQKIEISSRSTKSSRPRRALF